MHTSPTPSYQGQNILEPFSSQKHGHTERARRHKRLQPKSPCVPLPLTLFSLPSLSHSLFRGAFLRLLWPVSPSDPFISPPSLSLSCVLLWHCQLGCDLGESGGGRVLRALHPRGHLPRRQVRETSHIYIIYNLYLYINIKCLMMPIRTLCSINKKALCKGVCSFFT